jgi:predicted RNA-binding Zn ribbon-like protein
MPESGTFPEPHGGWLCLDFANTVEPRFGQPERDHLGGYADLVRWAQFAGALDTDAGTHLLRHAAARPAAARDRWVFAIEFREAIYRVFAAVAAGASPAATDLDTLRDAYADAIRQARLRAGDGRFGWTWDDHTLDLPWWPVALSAIDLATAGPVDRLKTCPRNGGCAWLFVDTTKNRSRRWCSMDTCGSEVKAKRQTARRRAARQAGRVPSPDAG